MIQQKTGPVCELSLAQSLVRKGAYYETKKSTVWMRAHGIDLETAKKALLKTREDEFVKSLPPAREGGSWADVYRVAYADDALSGEFYLKFVVEDDHAVVLMSFKEWGYAW